MTGKNRNKTVNSRLELTGEICRAPLSSVMSVINGLIANSTLPPCRYVWAPPPLPSAGEWRRTNALFVSPRCRKYPYIYPPLPLWIFSLLNLLVCSGNAGRRRSKGESEKNESIFIHLTIYKFLTQILCSLDKRN